MRKSWLALSLAFGLGSLSLAAPVNVALNATVTSNGTFGSSSSLLPSITDGMFVPENTQWQTGTVWWYGDGTTDPDNTPYLAIDLGSNFDISGLIVQADNNDSYTLQYESTLGGAWQTLWNIPERANGGGMSTRPNGNSTDEFSIATTSVRALKFFANQGDGDYSVSEIQLFGAASGTGGGASTPEPATWTLLAGGLTALVARRFRGRKANKIA